LIESHKKKGDPKQVPVQQWYTCGGHQPGYEEALLNQAIQSQIASEHFELQHLADGVYAAIGSPGSAAFSNAGIIDLGDQTIIFDTFQTPVAAQQLRRAAETLTGRPATHVIISHFHGDHWGGNQVFADYAPIISTHKTREGMPASIGWLAELMDNPSELEAELQGDRERLKEETDPRRRASLEAGISRYQYILEALPTLELRLPNLTFDRTLTFHGTERTAELHAVEPGHTASDAYLHLPTDGIVFLGDLGFFQCQPFLVYCDPGAWFAHLEQMEQTGIETFVPGHGPLGTKADLALQRQYISMLEELVTRVIKEGGSAEHALEQPLPSPFDEWLHGGMARFEANVQSAYERLSGKQAS
jgi:glyoxylase-like metal-dependent hydrolase (beta-lactamase superfamily II)